MRREEGLHRREHEHDACGLGLVARLDARPDHATIADALAVLRNLEHRGAVSGDGRSGDGAGLLCRIPELFFRNREAGRLPESGELSAAGLDAGLPWALGMFFLPSKDAGRRVAHRLVEYIAAREGFEFLGWRTVPVLPQVLGTRALASLPRIEQGFFGRPAEVADPERGEDYERRLFALRKAVEREALVAGFSLDDFSIPSLSSRTVVYKGMFVASQFASFYPDLACENFVSPFALVHQRYSTNTFPSWPLAQPFRLLAHNGEINTLRKNVAAMRGREAGLSAGALGGDLSPLHPLIQEEGSDSAIFDNVFELLVRAGRRAEHAFMMMVPEAWESGAEGPRRAFYEFHSALMEPWDGPAAMVFCDGARVGAATDRGGQRPFRFTLTSDGRFIGASEAGALDLDPSLVIERGKLGPGRMLLLDFASGRLLRDGELKDAVVAARPYGAWLAEHRIEMPSLDRAGWEGARRGSEPSAPGTETRAWFGFEEGTLRLLEPMLAAGSEAGAAMGTKKPPAILSTVPETLFAHFRQLFAQVTNPPMDPVREGSAMSLESIVGREENLLEEGPLHCRQLRLPRPLLSNEELAALREASLPGFRVTTLSTVFPLSDEAGASLPAPGFRLRAALDAVRSAVELRVDEGYSLIVLSDRGVDGKNASLPMLLALAAAHRRLVERGKRQRCALVCETGEAREVHDIAVLLGFGASAVNPWMVFDLLPELGPRAGEKEAAQVLALRAGEHYVEAVDKGLLKILSKLGISTISSYRGGGLFEAVGLSEDLVSEFFPGIESRVGGIGLEEIEAELFRRHREAFGAAGSATPFASAPARRSASEVPWPPRLTSLLTKAVRENDEEAFKSWSEGITSSDRPPFALRDLFGWKDRQALPIGDVEPVEAIVARFSVAAMSCGALGPEAHEALAAGANLAGAWSNSGEGGEDEERGRARGDGYDRRSASRQVASARFGVDARHLAGAREIQIKMAQGAKPGEGGQLPGAKVNELIARLRHARPGIGLISPPPHHDIYSIEDLSQLIHDLRAVNPRARIAVKLVAQAGIGAVAAGTAKAGADCVIVSGTDGGTGSAALSSIDHAGNWWELALPELRQVLAANQLSDRVSIQVDGRLRNGRDIVIAAILGAREFAFGTAALVALGCTVCGQCDKDGCPAGIATQKPELRARFAGSPRHVAAFLMFMAEDTRRVLASLGLRALDEASGRHELLDFLGRADGGRARLLDFSRLTQALSRGNPLPLDWGEGEDGIAPFELPPAPAGLAAFEGSSRGARPLPEPDQDLMEALASALGTGRDFEATRTIRNLDRSVGAALSGELVRRGLDRVSARAFLRFEGSAGQSFGAFLVESLSFLLVGEANDFVGKGLSGGSLALRPFPDSRFEPHRALIAGNVCLFGATAGRAFFNGKAGERFAVRNSGAIAVVEGTGDHACEYMTGGRVVILGETGRNFGAGMTGGLAFVMDEEATLPSRIDGVSVELLPLGAGDEELLRADLADHAAATGSPRAAGLLAAWESARRGFVKVSPRGS